MKKIAIGMIFAILVTGFLFFGCSKKSNNQIVVVSREEGSGTRGAFIELFGIEVKNSDGTKKDTTTKEAIIANKTDIMLTNVSSNENAIGYVSLGSLNSNVKALAIDGIPATTENVKSGAYKIARPFIIVTKDKETELSKDFIQFILSKEGQEVVAKSYIAVNANAAPYTGTKPAGKISIAGSSSVTPIMEKLKEAYEKINPSAVMEIQQSDSSAGIKNAIDGICNIGMSSRDLNATEKAQLQSITIAIDGIAVIVNTKNAINGLTKAQVNNIFTGTITAWNELQK